MAEPSDQMPAAAGRGHLRASHADREQVIGTLKAAFVQGMLAQNEFDERVGQAFESRTYAELAALTADLPAVPPAAQPPKPSRPQGGQPVLRPGRWIAVATVLYAGAWAYELFLSRHGDDQSAFPLIVGGFLIYLGVLIASVGAIIVNWQDRRSGLVPGGQDGRCLVHRVSGRGGADDGRSGGNGTLATTFGSRTSHWHMR